MKEILKGINTVIFDLGEVVIDLHPNKVIESLSEKWKIPKNQIKDLIINDSQLIDYETGKIDEDDLLNGIQKNFELKISTKSFEESWNLMIGDISDARRNILKKLQKNYQVLVLSNTNAMHERAFDALVNDKFNVERLSSLVDHAHYSHNMGLRKPDVKIYKALLDFHNLKPQECLFLDDKAENIESANQVGIVGKQVEFPDQILGLL